MDNYANKAEARNRARRVTLSGTAAAGAMTGRPSNGNIGQILKLLNNCDPLIRDGALKSLIRIGGREAIASVISCLDDDDPKVRSTAFKAVGQLRIVEMVDKAKANLGEPDDMVRCAAATGLALLGNKKGIDIVLKYANPKQTIRWEAVRCLNLITGKRFPANAIGLKDAVGYLKRNKKRLIRKTISDSD